RRIAMPPYLTNWAVEPLRLLRIVDLPPEVTALLRYGRGVDTTRFRQAGFRYEHTTLGTVTAFAEAMRLKHSIGHAPEYQYQSDVEAFFRHSPAVVRETS
ncbi:MAG: hypothetical protein MUP67_01970, partial [Acidimicrobiia bacterium]|nr:hypothetical protein [Acidimicrobiia bacterium]